MARAQHNAQKLGYDYGHMTLSECVNIAKLEDESVGEIIIEEACSVTGMSRDDVVASMEEAFAHNLKAVEIGLREGSSFLLGQVGQDLSVENSPMIVEDEFVNDIIKNTLAAQVGNHNIGLRPCAGTGDSCPYTGFIKGVIDRDFDKAVVARLMAVILKIGGMFRIGKRTTGCNMEGIGAGAAATAAAFVELEGGTPDMLEKAVVLAISPTIGVPCTPRVLVPGLCATHIGGGVMIARLASRLALSTSVPSTVPADVMIAMAAQCHLASAEYVVPVTIEYMEPFFKHDCQVDSYVDASENEAEIERRENLRLKATEQARELARKSNPITNPFGEAVVGGSSQGVGSPTNCGRIAHFLAKGEIKKITIELYSELFARRAINVPGILMAAVNGCGTSDAAAYKSILDEVRERGIEIEIKQVDERSVQRVVIEATEGNAMVDSLNLGGARLVLRDAKPSLQEALDIAKRLGIVVIEE